MSAADKDHILLVDDEKHLLISLRDYLTYDNFEVTIAQSGEDALEQLEKVTPDIIVLDISMPGMGGLGFLKRISTSEGKPKYPVLVLTARSMMADFFGNLDIDGFLAKPCEEKVLVNTIRAIITKRKAAAEKSKRSVRKIAIVEDDAEIARQIALAFSDAGYIVTIINSGPEVLEKAAGEKPDALVMKEILPRLNGSAVASLMEVMPSLVSVPVVLYDDSRHDSESYSAKLSRLKCVKRFVPSANPQRLLAATREILA